MKDVLSQFYVKKRTLPPRVPLCGLVVHDAVRFARDDNEWLISSFDCFAYLETMGHFLVSVGDSQGDVMHVTATNLENWGPLWRQCHDEFERKLGKEWQELKNKKFLDEFNAFMSKEIAKVDALGLNDLERRKRLDKATKVEEERWLKDRGYKYLLIANPLNGDEFFKLLFGIKWDDPGMLKITRDKLYCLTSSKITHERKKIILHLMNLTKSKDPQYPHFGDYKLFQGYMKKETYWAHLNGEATLLIERLQVEGPQLPHSFKEFYKMSMKNHIVQDFSHLTDTVRSSNTSKKMLELMFLAKRIIYRWIVQCVEEQVLDAKPMFTTEWINVGDVNTMFSPSLLERRLTSWEVLDLTISLWYRVGHPVPRFDRDAGEMISERLFLADCSYMWDDPIFPIDIDGMIA
ncbi:hypothetical protein L7F22_065303 [Adiantum nelumboides]|nr:hypothetical protein [Adiantum nelumboides]